MAGRLARATGATGATTSGRGGGRGGRGDSSRGALASGGRGRTSSGRGARERRVEAVEEDVETPDDPSTSYYAPLDGKRRRELASATAAAAKSKRIRKKAEAAMSDDAESRRLFVEQYTRELLATREGDGTGDGEDALKQKLGRDKALLLEDAAKTMDVRESRAEALKARFARANRQKLSRSQLRKRGFFGLSEEKCKWSTFSRLRALWEKYARGLVERAKHDEVHRLLTRGIDLHGCVVKVTKHARTPDVVGREGVIAYVSDRCVWLVSRGRDQPLKVLIDGATLRYVLDDREVTLTSDDIASCRP
jgi:hypothetical protein